MEEANLKAGLYIIGTPIGNLQDMTRRGLETLKNVDVIYCEDTRHSLKLLNFYEIRKPLKSCPHFKEQNLLDEIIERIEKSERVGFMTDAGMPGISDPGQILVEGVRSKGLKIEIIGGVSSLTYFLAGLGCVLDSFRFVGFLPPRLKDRKTLIENLSEDNLVFMESPHRIESSLELLKEIAPHRRLILGKELSKVQESFFDGTAIELLKKIPSFKGEWMGCLLKFEKEGD